MKVITKSKITWIYLATIPMIAFTTTLEIGIYSSLVLAVVILLTSLIRKYLSPHLSKDYSPYVYLLIVALQISIIQLISLTFVPFYENEIGLFLSLMIVNVVLIFPEEEKEEVKLKAILKNLLFATILLLLVGLFREVVGTATITFEIFSFQTTLFDNLYAITFLQTIPGGLLISGTILAVYGWIINARSVREGELKW